MQIKHIRYALCLNSMPHTDNRSGCLGLGVDSKANNPGVYSRDAAYLFPRYTHGTACEFERFARESKIIRRRFEGNISAIDHHRQRKALPEETTNQKIFLVLKYAIFRSGHY